MVSVFYSIFVRAKGIFDNSSCYLELAKNASSFLDGCDRIGSGLELFKQIARHSISRMVWRAQVVVFSYRRLTSLHLMDVDNCSRIILECVECVTEASCQFNHNDDSHLAIASHRAQEILTGQN